MRGKDNAWKLCQKMYRITPAYAGKSFLTCWKHWFQWDHPRLCGEKGIDEEEILMRSGSPPPMRGKVANVLLKIPVVGITPAYAGKSIFCHFIFKLLKDHPRLCGEKYILPLYFQAVEGSPPPMRGKVPVI